MGVIALPKYQTLFFDDRGRREGGKEFPSLEELGRFWLSDLTKKEKKMAFETIKVSELPVREFGRKATEPKVGLAGNGRFVFNKLVCELWGASIDRLLVQYDPTARILRFNPVAKGVNIKNVEAADYLKVSVSEKDKGISAGGARILIKIGYDYKSAGNQVYEAKLISGKDGKGKAYDIVIPETTPTPKPVVARQKRATGTPAGKPNGAVATPPPVVTEDELVVME